jgi:hypothetical protein
MAASRNPVTEILNIQPPAPTSVPQSGLPTVQGPTAVNLSTPADPVMTPQAPMMSAELPAPPPSLDLPASLQGLLGSSSPQVAINEPIAAQNNALAQTGTVASNPQVPVLDFRLQPTYAQGGMVGDNGMPVMPQGMQQGQPMDSRQLEMQLQDFMRKNPQQVQQIAQAIQAGLQSGEITMEELNMAEQMAMTALQNPDMYQYIRQFAIQQGMATEQDLSPQYDEGLIFVILLAVRSAKEAGGTGAAPMGGAQQPMMAMQGGGYIPKNMSPTKDGTGQRDDVAINVSPGEYVIPKKIVDAKGKEFFDNLLKKYA